MSARIQRSVLPDPPTLRRLLSERSGDLREGARLVDDDVQGPTGIDLVLVDEDGRPVFVDVVTDVPATIPVRLFDHEAWLDTNRRLFLRAYSSDGVVKAEEPVFVFVVEHVPNGVAKALASMTDVASELIRAEYVLLDGVGELLLERIAAGPRSVVSRAVAKRAEEVNVGRQAALEDTIDSEEVRALFALFRSGVDGLDGRISQRRGNGGVLFELGGRQLAAVNVSQGSFTVSPGDPIASPIVVSDRISLERALNAVVSLFVREGVEPRDGGDGGAASLDDAERAELRQIWGDGLPERRGEG